MSKREKELLLEDILECINRVFEYTEGMEFEDFFKDQKTIDAVIRNIEIIGEASSQMPKDFKKKNTQVPWVDIVDMRNKIIHEYFGIDLILVWEIIEDELETLKQQIQELT